MSFSTYIRDNFAVCTKFVVRVHELSTFYFIFFVFSFYFYYYYYYIILCSFYLSQCGATNDKKKYASNRLVNVNFFFFCFQFLWHKIKTWKKKTEEKKNRFVSIFESDKNGFSRHELKWATDLWAFWVQFSLTVASAFFLFFLSFFLLFFCCFNSFSIQNCLYMFRFDLGMRDQTHFTDETIDVFIDPKKKLRPIILLFRCICTYFINRLASIIIKLSFLWLAQINEIFLFRISNDCSKPFSLNSLT